jgi:hypothetical protein
MNNSALRNDIEVALLAKAQTDIDEDGATKAFSLTLLDGATALVVAQKVLRYLVVKYPEVSAPTPTEINVAVEAVYAKLSGA